MSSRIAGIPLLAGALWFAADSLNLSAQDKAPRLARVPFVGCKAYGQTESFPAPKAASQVLQIDANAALKPAYYGSAVAPGVLAQRGWYCEGGSGSGGPVFLISPEPIADFMQHRNGPVIELEDSSGENSGRFDIAEIVARVFPKEWEFARRTAGDYGIDIKFGPYPKDRLMYKSDRIVEYRTPPNSEGLGTQERLRPANDAIEGVAIL